jgi:hypothetical protein
MEVLYQLSYPGGTLHFNGVAEEVARRRIYSVIEASNL